MCPQPPSGGHTAPLVEGKERLPDRVDNGLAGFNTRNTIIWGHGGRAARGEGELGEGQTWDLVRNRKNGWIGSAFGLIPGTPLLGGGAGVGWDVVGEEAGWERKGSGRYIF